MPNPPRELRASFEPLRRLPRRGRAWLYLLGPVLWIVGLVLVAYVVRRGDAVGIALLVLAGAFVLSLVILVPMRARRVREERQPWGSGSSP